ncbi:MAG: NADH:flavin oxidoreductase [Actinomycetia bacterium]|nr:NADH:flavin oxidoreductase [Actinomycetes bacterium]
MYEHLLAPGKIGNLELRNRILLCPMGDELSEADGTVGERQRAYFEARAKGGAALLLVGSISVAYPRASFSERQVAASDDRFLPGLLELTDAVHRHGGRIAAQLVHNGQMGLLDVANGLPMLVPAIPKAPHPDKFLTMVTPAEMAGMGKPFMQPTSKVEYQVASEDDIAQVIQQFADAAERCVRAGFDGIELHAGHGYLLDEFLTPAMNDRTDGWGGGVEGRSRLLRECLRAIRARVGTEVPLWIRINAVEHHKEHGETFEEQLEVIDLCRAEGIDAVHVTAYASTDVATGPTDSYVPHTTPHPLRAYARAIKERVDVPVITYGRYEPDEADAVLARGDADFMAMGRKLLADPDLPNKLRDGHDLDVRPCIYQYRCIGNIFVNESLTCVANARTGREAELGEGPAATPRRVLVVGGGAAGLEATHVLAADGHDVTLWEAGDELGGVLRTAARTDGPLAKYLAWLLRRVERSGATVELGRRADVASTEGFDEIVVASGGAYGDLDLDHDGARVSIRGGDIPGVRIAALYAKKGRKVEVVEPSGVFAQSLGLPGRWRLVPDLDTAGVTLATEPGLDADVVIDAGRAPADDTLARELRAAGRAVTVVGDANPEGLGRLEGANLDVARLATRLRS